MGTGENAADIPPPPEDAKPTETKEEDPSKKELEAKNREIIDLKVCRISCAPSTLTSPIHDRSSIVD
jgi:hypothetical protein